MEKIRRYDLDWLRVIVFALLIFYHVGMFFVPWGWHIKNNEIYRWLVYPMFFLNQWRLPILFVISGMGTAYALSFRSAGEFRKERAARLGIPLVVGCLLIVPPQVYIERVYTGAYTGTYLEWFTSGMSLQGIYLSGNFSWHHLWFLPYLLVFSLILSPVFIKIRDYQEGRFISWVRKGLASNPYFLFWLIVPLYCYDALLEPFFNVTHNLVWDWFNFISSMTLFFYGYVLITVKKEFWEAVNKIWKTTLVIGLLAFATLLWIRTSLEDTIVVHFCEALVKVANLWVWILTIFGFAAQYLNKRSRVLAYANQAVYPFYILHQTVTIIIGYYLYDHDWSFLSKFVVLVIGTFGFSWVIYEFIIRRAKILWPLFGLKRRLGKD